ncbi:MAG: HAD family hydrolase [Bdellovibrionales bacterium]|nr:HAD family hydrolase [Bdellovibrionales bacterium]
MQRVLGLDLDGTVINSLGLTLEIMTSVLGSKGESSPSKEKIAGLFGLPEERIFDILAGAGKSEAIHQEYLRIFGARLPELKCFDGIVLEIQGAKARGMKVGLYTARGRAATQKILEHLHLLPLLDWWITGSDLQEPKPHPEGLMRMARQLGAAPADCYYVGDSPKDVKMARAAGFKAIAANWCSNSSEKDLLAEQPHHLLTDPRQLSSVLV